MDIEGKRLPEGQKKERIRARKSNRKENELLTLRGGTNPSKKKENANRPCETASFLSILRDDQSPGWAATCTQTNFL